MTSASDAQYDAVLLSQVTRHIDLPMWSVYVIQYAVFGTGLLGITYGILSARCAHPSLF